MLDTDPLANAEKIKLQVQESLVAAHKIIERLNELHKALDEYLELLRRSDISQIHRAIIIRGDDEEEDNVIELNTHRDNQEDEPA